jgi:hypothetical protein
MCPINGRYVILGQNVSELDPINASELQKNEMVIKFSLATGINLVFAAEQRATCILARCWGEQNFSSTVVIGVLPEFLEILLNIKYDKKIQPLFYGDTRFGRFG